MAELPYLFTLVHKRDFCSNSLAALQSCPTSSAFKGNVTIDQSMGMASKAG